MKREGLPAAAGLFAWEAPSWERVISVLVFGAVGVAILVSLGLWQVAAVAWKEAVLADIAGPRIGAAPVELPASPRPGDRPYLPVPRDRQVSWASPCACWSASASSAPATGSSRRWRRRPCGASWVDPGHRAPTDQTVPAPPVGHGERHRQPVTGPDEVDAFTGPRTTFAGQHWFSRDVEVLAAHLEPRAGAWCNRGPSLNPARGRG